MREGSERSEQDVERKVQCSVHAAMLERYRNYGPPVLVFCAVALLLALSGLTKYYQSGKGCQPGVQNGDQSCQKITQDPVFSYRPPAEKYPSRQEWREEKDLQAQRQMSQWALWMVGISITGTILIFLTLLETRNVLKETERTNDIADSNAKAAWAAVAGAKEDAEKARRPYIIYDTAKIDEWTVSDGKRKGWSVDVTFKNCGQSPGIVTGRRHAVFSPNGDGSWGQRTAVRAPVCATIGPGQSEDFRFDAIMSDKDGRFSWFEIRIELRYRTQSSETPIIEKVSLMCNGKTFRQDYTPTPWAAHMPDWEEENQPQH